MNILKKNLNLDEFIGIGLFVLSAILLLIMLYSGLNQSLWEDETYTLNIVSKSFMGMVSATANDVHPPLYYAILMLVFKFFSPLFPTTNIILAKLVSIVPLLLLLCFSLFILKKDFGWLVTGIFGFCIVTMPKIMYYSVEIRMYSWVMFFVTLSFYYAYKITEESNNKNWIIFSFFALFAAYTHYYGVLSVGTIYLILLIYSILKNKVLIKKWIFSIIFIILAYIPWIYFTFFNHKSSYFTNNLAFKNPIFQDMGNQIINFLFNPIYNTHTQLIDSLVLFFLFIIILLIVLYIRFRIIKNKEYSFNFIGLVGIFILIFTVGMSYLFSILSGRNTLVAERYVFPMVGCLWLSISVLLAKLYSKKIIFSLILLVFLLVGIISSVAFINYEHDANLADLKFKYYINQIDDNDTLLVLDSQWAGSITYIYKYYLNKEIIVFDRKSSRYDIENKLNKLNIKEMQQKGKIWFFDRSNGDSNIVNEFDNLLIKKGFSLYHVDEFFSYGNYPHDIYMINPLS